MPGALPGINITCELCYTAFEFKHISEPDELNEELLKSNTL